MLHRANHSSKRKKEDKGICSCCRLSNCENCKNVSERLKIRLFENYVYYNLEKYGNAFISKKEYKFFSIKEMEKDLQKNDFYDINIKFLPKDEIGKDGFIIYAKKKGV